MGDWQVVEEEPDAPGRKILARTQRPRDVGSQSDGLCGANHTFWRRVATVVLGYFSPAPQFWSPHSCRGRHSFWMGLLRPRRPCPARTRLHVPTNVGSRVLCVCQQAREACFALWFALFASWCPWRSHRGGGIGLHILPRCCRRFQPAGAPQSPTEGQLGCDEKRLRCPELQQQAERERGGTAPAGRAATARVCSLLSLLWLCCH